VWARRLVRRLGVHLQVEGAPPPGPVFLLANHRSYVDIVVLLAQLPCVFLAKEEIGGWPLFGRAARQQHTVFVKREDKTSRRAARQAALATVKRGLPFAAFPEGTTFRGPGALPFFPGLFQVAAHNAIPVVPVAIEYGDPSDAWVADESFAAHFLRSFRRRRVFVRLAFGPRLHPAWDAEAKDRAEAWIAGRLAAFQGGRAAALLPARAPGRPGRRAPAAA
jgi:1-acyl-sn-glycerol-3-phosphate acyltransferase